MTLFVAASLAISMERSLTAKSSSPSHTFQTDRTMAIHQIWTVKDAYFRKLSLDFPKQPLRDCRCFPIQSFGVELNG